MDHVKAKADLEALMAANGIEFTCAPILARTDGATWAEGYRHTHYTFTFTGNGAVHTGQYSKGCADVLEALKKGCINQHGRRVPLMLPGMGFPDKDTLQRVLGGSARPWDKDIPLFRKAMFDIAGKLRPSAVDVFGSMLLDASGSDQTFEDWAFDHGYSDDSMSAKKTWETCNDIRRALQRMLGDNMETALELAHEL